MSQLIHNRSDQVSLRMRMRYSSTLSRTAGRLLLSHSSQRLNSRRINLILQPGLRLRILGRRSKWINLRRLDILVAAHYAFIIGVRLRILSNA